MICPTFTSDWFTESSKQWITHVIPHFVSLPNIHWLEIGSYEGRSALWTLENVLTGPRSDIICVDSFGLPGLKIPEYEKTFDSNVSGIDRLLKLKGFSSEILPILPAERFLGIYVDGSHEEPHVRKDIREAWRLARPGAILIFDDYPHPDWPGVKIATDELLQQQQGQYKLLHKAWQVIIRKEKNSQ
jgi:hypothetical protein